MNDQTNNMPSPSSYRRLIERSKSSVDSDSNWLITLSDVLSLLLVFFMIFFVMTKNTKKQDNAEQAKAQSLINPVSVMPQAIDVVREGVETHFRHAHVDHLSC